MHAHRGSDKDAQVSHGHSHGAVDGEILASGRGIRATKISLAVLLVTAVVQLVIVGFTGSVALLADTIHNFGDAATALPLWAAFTLSRKLPTKRFNYGYGRAEDLAGLLIVLSILATGIFAAYESISRLGNPPEIDYLWIVAMAAVIGFAGNEGVALYRMKVGKEIGSAALIADGHHARVDGLTSLAVLFGALGVWLGYPLADPIVGLVISVAILRIVVETAKSVFSRLLDGVEPEVPDEVRDVASLTHGVREVSEVRVRWLGHKMLAEVNIAVDPSLSVVSGHDIAEDVHHQLLLTLEYLSNATVHVDPVGLVGEEFHMHGLGNTEHQIEHEEERGHDLDDNHNHGYSHGH
ncbi:MAG: cation diffusion facilitator family transporter [Dehalococcoidia bacterium]|nr:cation diffusion facilitator family transporter [Dehalococcoidia bacterium]